MNVRRLLPAVSSQILMGFSYRSPPFASQRKPAPRSNRELVARRANGGAPRAWCLAEARPGFQAWRANTSPEEDRVRMGIIGT
jgi:hypothetical protein